MALNASGNVLSHVGEAANFSSNTQYLNTGNVRLQNRYVDGVYTSESLWPWPYEDIIERDFQLGETLTDMVFRLLVPVTALQLSLRTILT